MGDSSETEIDPLDGQKINKSKEYNDEEAKMEESDDYKLELLAQNEEELNNLNALLVVKNEKIKELLQENEQLKEEKLSDDKGKKIKELLRENERLQNEKNKLKY